MSRRRISDADREEFSSLYAEGLSIRGVKDVTGWSYGAIHRSLVGGGVVLRSRGGNRRDGGPK